MLERLFQLQVSGTTIRTELVAGLTTFLTMAYIVFVNPDILAVTGASVALGPSEFKGIFAAPPSLAPTFMQLDLAGALNAGLLAVVLTFFMVELFDATGTLVGGPATAPACSTGKAACRG